MQAPPSLRNFISAFHGHWFEAMSGGVSVPFAILAVLLDNAYAKVILGLLAATAAGFAAYQAWAWEEKSS